MVLVHTDVATSAEGSGVGSALVAGALDDIRSRGLRVVPVCPFVAAYIHRHPEDAALVAPDPATRTERAGVERSVRSWNLADSDLSEGQKTGCALVAGRYRLARCRTR